MPGLKVQFLGSGDAFGHGGCLQACILLQWEGRRVLLDCGASAMISLQRYGVEPNSIHGILISHLHGDHFGGLPFFILDAQLHSKRTAPLLLAGPVGLAPRLEQAMEVNFPGSSQIQRKFATQITELAPGPAQDWCGLSVRAAEGLHASGAPALALRIEAAGKSLAYTGDTQWVDDLSPLLSGADLLIAEAYFHERPIKFHLSCTDVLARRGALNPGRLIFTHMSQDMLAHVGELPGETADDGLELIL
ncbi:MAG: MBL fold metallo-hydrolase [Desulfarculaceae bacterium]|nr:MBL fold metallo-hydrolase [Desulfarculaceae bacterium]MCF8046384.1 MBL fold metallo-hydrolase [Desulfarculaceae bacterium]MCF8099887.1 MBL fold metallo-hydrolase [Desulfarculaceae bacterium]MCF8123200.1 MBL fold metallo-hydrolase [Desulfarculaceae bacterium]